MFLKKIFYGFNGSYFASLNIWYLCLDLMVGPCLEDIFGAFPVFYQIATITIQFELFFGTFQIHLCSMQIVSHFVHLSNFGKYKGILRDCLRPQKQY